MLFNSHSRPVGRGATALALCLALALPVAAEPGDLKLMALSAELYARGMADGDAVLVIAAAKLRQQRGSTILEDIVISSAKDGGQGPKTGTEGRIEATPRPHAAPITWEEMLDSARVLAEGDDALLAMIEDVAAESSKGVTTGQVYSISQIDDGGEDVYDNLPFAAGEYAEVYVESADGSDLNLYVYDAAGRLVCSDTDISAISYCGWRPSEGGAFTIKVENRGQGDAGYSLMTN